MKRYIIPAIATIKLETVKMIAASGDSKTDVSISNTVLEGVTFGARENGGLWDDDEE